MWGIVSGVRGAERLPQSSLSSVSSAFPPHDNATFVSSPGEITQTRKQKQVSHFVTARHLNPISSIQQQCNSNSLLAWLEETSVWQRGGKKQATEIAICASCACIEMSNISYPSTRCASEQVRATRFEKLFYFDKVPILALTPVWNEYFFQAYAVWCSDLSLLAPIVFSVCTLPSALCKHIDTISQGTNWNGTSTQAE